MNTMMKAEIASETSRSRSHTPNAGRKRTPDVTSEASVRAGNGACLFPDSDPGESGMRFLLYTDRVSSAASCTGYPGPFWSAGVVPESSCGDSRPRLSVERSSKGFFIAPGETDPLPGTALIPTFYVEGGLE